MLVVQVPRLATCKQCKGTLMVPAPGLPRAYLRLSVGHPVPTGLGVYLGEVEREHRQVRIILGEAEV